jgi:hypothetical protein
MNYKSVSASILAAVLQVYPISSFAASWHSEPNPIGEKAYAAHSVQRLIPVAIIVCGLLFAWLVARIQAKTRKSSAHDTKPLHHLPGM